MSRQFTQKVQMPCTAAQYRLIHPDLLKMGYQCLEPGGPDSMKTVFVSNGFVEWHHKDVKKSGFTPIDTFSPVLFLALAACSDSEFGVYGEYWTFIGPDDCFTRGKIYRQINNDVREPGAFIDNDNIKNGFSGKGENPVILTKFRKATITEIFQQLAGIPDEQPRKGGWNETHDGEEIDQKFKIGQPILYKNKVGIVSKFDPADLTYKIEYDSCHSSKWIFEKELSEIEIIKEYEIPSAPEGRVIREGGPEKLDKPTSFFDQTSPESDQYPTPLPDYEEPQPTDIPTRNDWEKSRIKMLWGAISAYVREDRTLPDPWVNEFAELLHKRAEDLPF